MIAPGEQYSSSEAAPIYAPQLPSYEQLAALGDQEYLAAGRAFGALYYDIVAGDATGGLAAIAQATVAPYLRPLRNLSNAAVAATMLRAYRLDYNSLCRAHGVNELFENVEPDTEDMSRVEFVRYSPIGIPVLGINDTNYVFRRNVGTSGFCVPWLMQTAGLPPLVVTIAGSSEAARSIRIHEASHATWAILLQAGVIPALEKANGSDEQSAALDTARNEATALQIAGQGTIRHYNVQRIAERDGEDPAIVDRYRRVVEAYQQAMRFVLGIKQSDAVLGFMTARSWDDFFAHSERMTRLAEAAPHAASAPIEDGWAWV